MGCANLFLIQILQTILTDPSVGPQTLSSIFKEYLAASTESEVSTDIRM